MTRVGFRGSTDRADDVVIIGPGMTNVRYGDAPYGIWTGGDVRGITIANLTIRDFYLHPIIFNAGTVAPHLYNVRLVNAGQQFVKANPSADGRGVDDGLVEYTVIEYHTRSKDDYTNGVDVHGGRNWTIRNSLFRNIRAPIGALAGPAILMWNGASNTTVEGNTFVNCQREIAFGLIYRAPYDHAGGVVRNNFIYRDRGVHGDVAIGVFASPRTQVLHNTILISGTYPHAIEYRFARTNGVAIRNNLLDADVRPRDGATALVSGNSTTGAAPMFVNAPAGDLHLAPTASVSRGIPLQEVPVDWDGEPQGPGATAGRRRSPDCDSATVLAAPPVVPGLLDRTRSDPRLPRRVGPPRQHPDRPQHLCMIRLAGSMLVEQAADEIDVEHPRIGLVGLQHIVSEPFAHPARRSTRPTGAVNPRFGSWPTSAGSRRRASCRSSSLPACRGCFASTPECGTPARRRADRAAGTALRGCAPCSCDRLSPADRSADRSSDRRTPRAAPRSSTDSAGTAR